MRRLNLLGLLSQALDPLVRPFLPFGWKADPPPALPAPLDPPERILSQSNAPLDPDRLNANQSIDLAAMKNPASSQ